MVLGVWYVAGKSHITGWSGHSIKVASRVALMSILYEREPLGV